MPEFREERTKVQSAIEPEVDFDRTHRITERLKSTENEYYDEPDTDPLTGEPDGIYKYGWLRDRHIIGHDVPINGGIYLGAGRRERIVVDDSKEDRDVYDHAYTELIKRANNTTRETHQNFKHHILSDVYQHVVDTMEFDRDLATTIANQYENQKVQLAYFIANERGVCRHQSLYAAYLLERLVRDGYLQGQVSIDRNGIKGRGAHAWVRYTTSSGEPVIIDVTQGYHGHLDDVPENAWFYRRPEDGPAPER